MNQSNRQLLINTGLALTLVMLIAIGGLAYQNMRAMVDAENWENHTYIVLRNLDDLLSSVKEAEGGQRGFILTGDSAYLATYQEAAGRTENYLATLRRLTRDNPGQQARLNELDPLLKERTKLFEQSIDLRKTQGFEAASNLVKLGRGKQLMADICDRVGQAAHAEEALLKDQNNQKIMDTDKTIITIVLGGLLSIGILVYVFMLLKRELARRLAAEKELLQHRDRLAEEVAERTVDLRRTAQFPLENPNPIWRVRPNGEIIFTNQPAQRMLGEMGWQEGQALPAILQEDVELAMSGGKVLEIEIGIGGKVYDIAFVPVAAEGYVNLYARDITRRRRAEDALRASEGRVRQKLESILSPEGDLSRLDLADIIDAPAIQELMSGFYQLTRVPMAIIDLKGQVLVGVGWQKICTDFHRVNSESCAHCIESDTVLSEGVPAGDYRVYRCKNNMNDVATPIVIGGRKFGNLFTGQFFFEDEQPDREVFRAQARQYGFDEEGYLAALDAVPRLSRQEMAASMAFLMKFAGMISKLSYSNLRLARSQEEIGRQREWLRVTLSSIGDAVLTADTEGQVTFLNPAAEALTGWKSDEVLGRPTAEIFRIVNEQTGAACEDIVARVLREKSIIALANHTALINRRGTEIPIEDSAAPILDAAGKVAGAVLVFHDVTPKRRIQQERETTIEFLRLVNESAGVADLVRSASTFFQKQSRCEAVGIRLAEDEDYPYYEARGFPEEFVRLENSLCSRDCTGQIKRDAAGNPVIECMCGNVICGQTNPEKPFFTPHGSFWSNSTSRLLAGTTDADRQTRTRNRCNGEGYESVALLPLRVGEQRLGLLQLNSRHEGMFTPEIIEEWERLADHLAVALAKFRSEEALQEREERLRLFIDHAPAALAMFDRQMRYISVSRRWLGDYGLAGAELRGKWHYEVFPEISENWKEIHRRGLNGEVISADAECFERADGSVQWLRWEVRPWYDAAGTVAGIVIFSEDITERKRVEEEIRQNREWLRVTLASIGDAVLTTDAEGRITFLNPVAEALTGWKNEEAQQQPATRVFNIINEKTGEPAADIVGRVLREKCIIALANHTALVTRAGETTPIEDSAAPILNAAGEINGAVLVFHDVTAKRRAQEELRQSEERFRAMADAIPQLAWIAQADGFIYWYNQRWYAYTGTTPQQMEGWGWQSVHDPAVLPSVLEKWKASIATGVPFDMVFPLRGADGRFRPFLTRVMPLKDAEGRVVQWFGTNTDVTERIEAEEALRESEERLRVIMDNSPDPIFLKDREGRLLLANPATLAAIGKPGKEILGHTDAEFYADPEIGRAMMENDRRVMDLGRTEVIEEIVKEPAGLPRTFLSTKTPHRDAEGRVIGLVGIARDITERKQAEEERQTTLRRFYSVLSSMYGAILLVNDENRVEFVNQAFCDMVGLEEGPGKFTAITSDEMIEKIRESFQHPEEDDKRIEEIVSEGKPVRGEEVAMRNRQTYLRDFIPISIDGKSCGRLWHHVNITERKRLEDALMFLIQCGTKGTDDNFFQSLAQYLADNLEMDFVCIDKLLEDDLTAQTVAVFYDGRFEDNMAYTLKDTPCGDVVGKTICCFPRDVCRLFPRDEVLQQMNAESYVGTTLWSSQGQPIGLIAVIGRQPLTNPKLAESILRMVSVRAAGELERQWAEEQLRTDVAKRKKAEEALRVVNAELADADRRKDEFLAMLAHELRNPLAPVRNAVQVMRVVGSHDPVLLRQRDIIERQVGHMARLLDDLLDISRITRGKIELQRRPIYLADALAHAIETATPLIESRRHTLSIQLAAEDLRLEADADRLAQIVGNLLANAAKYTESGGRIWLETAREGEEAIIRVRDNGVGIAPEMLPRVFELFAQADRSLDRSQGGLGIGLTLVKNLVEMHGGRVAAHSAGLGQGSEFEIRLPLLNADAGGAAAVEEPEQSFATQNPRRVLLVEDVIDSAESLTMLLELWGHTVRTAHDGPAGLEAAREFQPEIVLLDIGLPGMNGFEVARILRREYGRAMRIVALTGYVQDSDRQTAQEAGFDAHLAKPVDIEKLQELLK